MSDPAPRTIGRRILVRCPNWLGDVVMATPGLRGLRLAVPEAWIVAQVPRNLMPLLEGIDVCDEVWPLEPRSAGASLLWSEARRVAEGRFDLGIVIPESISSALRMRLGGVARIVGFARDPIRRLLLHEIVPAPKAWGARRLVSRERFVATLMQALGAPTQDMSLHLEVTEEERETLDVVLARHGLSRSELDARPAIVLAPGASFGDSKCWPAEYYAELADRFALRGESVIILGGPGENALLESVKHAVKSSVVLLDAELDLGGVKALLQSARLLVANDAGARHVAAAFRVPSLIFLGPTSLEKTADNLQRVRILEREFDCRPCYARTCPIDHRCLRSISVDDADKAAILALADFHDEDDPTSSQADFGADP